MSIFSSIVSRSNWSRTCEWCEGPRWWKGRNLCLIVRTQFSVLDAHNLLQHGVALPQWKVSSSSSSLQLESNSHLSLVRLDLEVLYLVQIGKLHGLTKMHLRQLMISASFSAEWSNLVVVAMPVVVVPPEERTHSGRLVQLTYHHGSMKVPHCSRSRLHWVVFHHWRLRERPSCQSCACRHLFLLEFRPL